MAQATATNGTEQDRADLNERTHLVITIPLGLKIALDKRAADSQISTSAMVRNMVAQEFDYTLPDSTRTRARKYATEEERQAALKQRRDERNNLFKALLAKYKAGEIELDEPVGAGA